MLADNTFIIAVTAPASGGTPATIRSLLAANAYQLAALGARTIAQIDVYADATDIYVRDSVDTTNRPNDYAIAYAASHAPVTIAAHQIDSKAFLISSGAAAAVRLVMHLKVT